jgi:hypothetical protein
MNFALERQTYTRLQHQVLTVPSGDRPATLRITGYRRSTDDPDVIYGRDLTSNEFHTCQIIL